MCEGEVSVVLEVAKAKDLRTQLVHYIDETDLERSGMWGTTFCGIQCLLRDWRSVARREVTCLRCLALEDS